MDGFEFYKLYLAMKLHFTSEGYDVIAKNGRVSAGWEAYNKRSDKFIFEKLGFKLESARKAVRFLAANFSQGNMHCIYDQDKAFELLKRWVKVKESLTMIFTLDLHTIEDVMLEKDISWNQVINCTNNSTSVIINLYKAGKITLETLSLISKIDSSFLEEHIHDDSLKLVYSDDILRIRKAMPFVKLNSKCESLYKEFVNGI